MLKLPVLVNDREVGQVVVTRQPNSPDHGEEWRYHSYRWEARWEDREEHQWQSVRGEVHHRPIEGLFRLISLVSGAVNQDPRLVRRLSV